MITATIQYPQETKIQYYQEVQSPLFISLDGQILSSEDKEMLNVVKPSGIVLFLKNISNYNQTKSLIESIHNYGEKRGIRIKVAIDEEGGVVSRLSGLKGYPGTSNTKTHSQFIKDLGIDINLAPVSDIGDDELNPIYIRTLGNNPSSVSKTVEEVVSATQEVGVSSTLKHFPGLGRAKEDTHFTLPEVDQNKINWLEHEGIPFKENLSARYIMTGHIKYPEIDDRPATISRIWHDILRDELGYRGYIMSDDLKMGALDSYPSSLKCIEGRTDNQSRIKRALDAGTNFPMILLDRKETEIVYSAWLEVEKKCL